MDKRARLHRINRLLSRLVTTAASVMLVALVFHLVNYGA